MTYFKRWSHPTSFSVFFFQHNAKFQYENFQTEDTTTRKRRLWIFLLVYKNQYYRSRLSKFKYRKPKRFFVYSIKILQLARIDYENAQFDETNYNELTQRDVFGKKGPHSKPAAVTRKIFLLSSFSSLFFLHFCNFLAQFGRWSAKHSRKMHFQPVSSY